MLKVNHIFIASVNFTQMQLQQTLSLASSSCFFMTGVIQVSIHFQIKA